MEMTDLQRNALTEFITIGYGDLEEHLERFVHQPVQIELPDWQTCYEHSVDQALRHFPQRVVAIEQEFIGEFSGKGFLVLRKEDAFKFSSAILGEEQTSTKKAKLELDDKDALKELTNVIINRIICSADNFLGDAHDFQVPKCFTIPTRNIFNIYTCAKSFPLLFMKTKLRIASQEVHAIFGLVLNSTNFDALLGRLESKYPGCYPSPQAS